MAIFIFIVIIIVVAVVGAVKFGLSRLMLAALHKISEGIPSANEEPATGIPENPGLSDAEIIKKLRVLQTVRKVYKLTGPVIILSIFGFFILHLGESMGIGEFFLKFILPVGIVFVLMMVVGTVTSKRMSELKSIMGASVTLPVLREVFELKTYRPHDHIGREVVDPAGLVSRTDLISGSDYFEGVYKGINILCSDLWLGHKESDTDSDGKSTTKTVTDFLGQWLVCDFGKELAASVRLKERGAVMGRIHDISKSDIETEDVAFNKKYRIITDDGHAAFYLLTPHFMERLMAADEKADSSTHFCFQNGKVHIALDSGRDSFELGNVNPNKLEDLRQRFRDDIRYMTDVLDTLLLNDTLFRA